jgi:hypothetical protein
MLGQVEMETKLPSLCDSSDTKTPYWFDGNYTGTELATLRQFMHANFPHLIYGGSREENK